MSALEGFNRVAPFYDALGRLVFGSTLVNSQLHFLGCLPKGGNILILGGGSGGILPPLLATSPSTRVWYVDASSAMIRKARERLLEDCLPRVTFIHGTEESIPLDVTFNAAITHFYLDLFPETAVAAIAQKIWHVMSDDGVWLVTDFRRDGNLWHRILLWLMYRFFVMACGIAARKLAAWDDILKEAGFTGLQSASYYGGFIQSCVFGKRS